MPFFINTAKGFVCNRDYEPLAPYSAFAAGVTKHDVRNAVPFDSWQEADAFAKALVNNSEWSSPHRYYVILDSSTHVLGYIVALMNPVKGEELYLTKDVLDNDRIGGARVFATNIRDAQIWHYLDTCHEVIALLKALPNRPYVSPGNTARISIPHIALVCGFDMNMQNLQGIFEIRPVTIGTALHRETIDLKITPLPQES